MKPVTISEQMQYNTVRLNTESGSGTGFFFQFNIGSIIVPVIVTNKHVINNNPTEKTNFSLHINNGGQPTGEIINISFNTERYFHPTQDLCFCFFNPLLENIKNTIGKDIFFIPITKEIIYDNTKLETLSAIEDTIMVGYPIGLCDEKHNLPLFRKGITSSHPAIDFNKQNIGAVDMACFPGSSGSPIFILNENGYSAKNGTTYMGTQRLIFLGILFEGPQFNTKGGLIIQNIPTQQYNIESIMPVMINLGYYIKAIELLEFESIISEIIETQKTIMPSQSTPN